MMKRMLIAFSSAFLPFSAVAERSTTLTREPDVRLPIDNTNPPVVHGYFAIHTTVQFPKDVNLQGCASVSGWEWDWALKDKDGTPIIKDKIYITPRPLDGMDPPQANITCYPAAGGRITFDVKVSKDAFNHGVTFYKPGRSTSSRDTSGKYVGLEELFNQGSSNQEPTDAKPGTTKRATAKPLPVKSSPHKAKVLDVLFRELKVQEE